MRQLAGRMRMLSVKARRAHGWSEPVLLGDQVIVISFQDLSARGRGPWAGGQSSRDYVLNLVRPVVFPFLQDCAQVAQLKLTDRIEISLHQDERPVAELAVRWDQITDANGEDLLVA